MANTQTLSKEVESERSEFCYNQDGASLSVENGRPLLSYESHGHTIRRKLAPGKPISGTGEFVEKECGLHVFYDAPISSWIIAHNLPHHRGDDPEEWFEDTIFVPDRGKITVKKGFSPVKPGVIWRHAMTLIALIIGSAIGLWAAVLLKVGCGL